MAEAELGRGNRAFEVYSKIAPAFLEDISEIHRLEPYVYSQMVAGRDAVRFGEAKNSWLTGTASWNFVAVSQSILGIKPDFDGLRIEPCLPDELKEYEIKRIYRGNVYNIRVQNKTPGGKIKIIDGKTELNTAVVPVKEAGTVQNIEVIIG